MSEEILRIKMAELHTVRVVQPDGRIITLATDKLSTFAPQLASHSRDIDALGKLEEAFRTLSQSGIVEFEIVVPKSA